MPPLKLSRSQWLATLACGLLAILVTHLAACRYGLGVSADGIAYLSAADSFAGGRGIIDYRGDPMVNWGPLYPAVVGTLEWASGLGGLASGEIINEGAAFLIVVCTALLFASSELKRKQWFFLALLVAAGFPSLLTLSANMGSDTLFILALMLFLLAARHFYSFRDREGFAAMVVIAAISTMIRWAGLSLIASGVVLVAVKRFHEKKRWLGPAFLFGLLGMSPFLVWIFGRNYRLTGTLLGPRVIGEVLVWPNVLFSYDRISHWFLPYFISDKVGFAIFVGLAIIALGTINRSAQWRSWAIRVVQPELLPVWIVTLVYLTFVTLTTFTHDHIDAFDDRYQVVVLVPLLLLLLSTIEELLLPHLSKIGEGVLLSLLAAWVVYFGFEFVQVCFCISPIRSHLLQFVQHRRLSSLGLGAISANPPF